VRRVHKCIYKPAPNFAYKLVRISHRRVCALALEQVSKEGPRVWTPRVNGATHRRLSARTMPYLRQCDAVARIGGCMLALPFAGLPLMDARRKDGQSDSPDDD
jgi:hypothetical protein